MVTLDPPKISNQSTLEQCLSFWKEVLGLQPWDIRATFERAGNLDGYHAKVTYKPEKELAILRVMDPIDWHDIPWPQDVEASIVHELLHILLWPLDYMESGPLSETHTEQIIERLTRALVNLRRYGDIAWESARFE